MLARERQTEGKRLGGREREREGGRGGGGGRGDGSLEKWTGTAQRSRPSMTKRETPSSIAT